MAQINIYLDETTKKKVQQLAHRARMSLSQLVLLALERYISESWPPGFFELYGSLGDSDFNKQSDLDFSSDSARESF